MTKPIPMVWHAGVDTVRLTTALDTSYTNESESASIGEDLKENTLRLISLVLKDEGLGSGFLYMGSTPRWLEVANDRNYDPVSREVSKVFKDFLVENKELIESISRHVFYGAGDVNEFNQLMHYVPNISRDATMEGVDVSPIGLLRFVSACNAYGFNNHCIMFTDIIEASILDNDGGIAYLKGGTSGNLFSGDLERFLKSKKDFLYIDYFVSGDQTDEELISIYSTESIKELAIGNYRKLFVSAGFTGTLDKKITFEVVRSTYGKDLVCRVILTQEVIDYMHSNSVQIPKEIELFRSARRDIGFSNVIEETSGMTVIGKYRGVGVESVFLSR